MASLVRPSSAACWPTAVAGTAAGGAVARSGTGGTRRGRVSRGLGRRACAARDATVRASAVVKMVPSVIVDKLANAAAANAMPNIPHDAALRERWVALIIADFAHQCSARPRRANPSVLAMQTGKR